MKVLGIVLALLGWLVALSGILLTQGNGARLALAVFGIGISIFGILGVLNPAYQKHAIWKS